MLSLGGNDVDLDSSRLDSLAGAYDDTINILRGNEAYIYHPFQTEYKLHKATVINVQIG